MPTAFELTRDEWGSYFESARHQLELPTLTTEEIRQCEQLLARIQEAADQLKRRYSVRRVVLFGSLAHRGWYAQDSEVDLAVECLDSSPNLPV
jgi:hypothetical protein